MDYIVSVDSGGTKCSTILVCPDGQVLDFLRLEEEAVSGRNLRLVNEAISRILPDERTDVFFTFHCHRFPQGLLKSMPEQRAEIMAITEGQAGRALADCDRALVVICGTGTCIFYEQEGRDDTGRYDGLGPLFGDFGSGVHIGLLAMRAVCRARIHKRHHSCLLEDVREALGDKIRRFIQMELTIDDRPIIAGLATCVLRGAEAGDAVCLRILSEAADELTITIVDALDNEGLRDEAVPVVFNGGLTASDLYWQLICERLQREAPKTSVTRENRHPLVAGLVLAGMKTKLPAGDYRKFRESFLASLCAFQ